MSVTSILWLKVIDCIGRGFAFVIFGYVAIWLIKHRGVGHRGLIWMIAVFCGCNCISQFQVAYHLYSSGASMGVFWITTTSVTSMMLASYTLVQRANLLRTLKTSEKKDVERKHVEMDRSANIEMGEVCTEEAASQLAHEARSLRQLQTAGINGV